jgi:hypothetical protein
MTSPVAAAYQQLDDARPLVRPTYAEFEVAFLPPYGDPEVHLLGELGTYLAAGLLVNAVTELLHDE